MDTSDGLLESLTLCRPAIDFRRLGLRRHLLWFRGCLSRKSAFTHFVINMNWKKDEYSLGCFLPPSFTPRCVWNSQYVHLPKVPPAEVFKFAPSTRSLSFHRQESVEMPVSRIVGVIPGCIRQPVRPPLMLPTHCLCSLTWLPPRGKKNRLCARRGSHSPTLSQPKW